MELESTRIFVKVVELGSFSRAAELLKLPKSTVSRTVSRLEAETGTKLLFRTTRSLKMTAAGLAFYESCSGAVRQLEEARRSLQGSDSIVAGRVKITAPEDLGNHIVAPIIARLIKDHPGLMVDFAFTDEVVDMIEGGFDLAVRLGKLRESRLKFKKLGEVTLIPVAAPAYLKNVKVRSPEDLKTLDCLSYTATSTKWTFHSKKGIVTVPIQPRATGDQMKSLVQLAVHGAGVGLLPHYLCREEVDSGQLVRLLPGWDGQVYQASLVSPMGLGTSARLKLLSDQLTARIREALS